MCDGIAALHTYWLMLTLSSCYTTRRTCTLSLHTCCYGILAPLHNTCFLQLLQYVCNAACEEAAAACVHLCSPSDCYSVLAVVTHEQDVEQCLHQQHTSFLQHACTLYARVSCCHSSYGSILACLNTSVQYACTRAHVQAAVQYTCTNKLLLLYACTIAHKLHQNINSQPCTLHAIATLPSAPH